MIPAAPTRFHRALLARYFRRRLAAAFHSVGVRGLDRLAPWGPGAGAEAPLLLLANHSCWWDAVLPIYLSLDLLGHDAYGVMEERQLARYTFFRRAGIFSIDRENARGALESLRYASSLLGGRRRVLWFFPQGEIVPNDRRPIECAPGAAHLVRMLDRCFIAPVALRYEMAGEERPEAWASIGPIVEITSGADIPVRALTARITDMLTAEVDLLREHVIAGDMQGFSPVLRGRRSIDTWWDRVRGREATARDIG